jgi:hypothetical protein
LDDCVQYFGILQASLVAMASELDNYPQGGSDAYAAVNGFPDEIMRKNILDDLKPFEQNGLPRAPWPPPCENCALANLMDETRCRIELKHIDPSWKYSSTEREEFLRSTKFIAARHRQFKSLSSSDAREKKHRRKWSTRDFHSLLLGISIYGKNDYYMLSAALGDRNPDMVGRFS